MDGELAEQMQKQVKTLEDQHLKRVDGILKLLEGELFQAALNGEVKARDQVLRHLVKASNHIKDAHHLLTRWYDPERKCLKLIRERAGKLLPLLVKFKESLPQKMFESQLFAAKSFVEPLAAGRI